MQKTIIAFLYNAAIYFTDYVQNFDLFCGKIMENLNQNSIFNFEVMLLNRYWY